MSVAIGDRLRQDVRKAVDEGVADLVKAYEKLSTFNARHRVKR